MLVAICRNKPEPTGEPYHRPQQRRGDLPRERQLRLRGPTLVRGVHQDSQPERHPVHGPSI